MAEDYDRTKHLELIVKTIERMDKASYALKALSPAAVAVALVLIERNVPAWLALAGATLAVLTYWYLDAQSLGRERSFRKLYDRVRKAELDNDPYTMDVGHVFGKAPAWGCMSVGVVAGIHGAALGLILVALLALSIFPRT
jgi:hypothetical protein